MPFDDYVNFDMLVLPAGENGYQARVTQSPVGQATHAFTLPFTHDELRRLFWVMDVNLRRVRLDAIEAGLAHDLDAGFIRLCGALRRSHFVLLRLACRPARHGHQKRRRPARSS